MFIVHGEETTAVEFAEHVKNEVGFDALAPYSGDAYDLLTGEQIAQGSRQLVEKKTQGVYRAKSGAVLTRIFNSYRDTCTSHIQHLPPS